VKIKNVSSSVVLLSDMKNPFNALAPFTINPNEEVSIYDEDAEKSEVLASLMTAGTITKISALEPSDSELSADTDVAATSHTHSNKTTLDSVTAAFTTAMSSKLSGIEASSVALATVKADTDIASAISLKHDASGQPVKGVAAVQADATDLPSALLLVNELKGILNTMNA
jgi:hypothetical protein